MHVIHPLRLPNSAIRAKATRRGDQPRPAPMQGRPPTVRPRPKSPARGQPIAARVSPQGRPTSLAGAVACSATPAKGASYRAPGRGCRPRPALLPARVAAPVAGVAVPWQGGCQRARATVACARAIAATTAV
ncbi:hypothetical protein GW17_00048459 [Ensete ventricosum]|nr:hypothetical protein GW17_00048459 [Ensete ventricosum]